MKVLLLNGSSNLKGCTYTALEEIAKTLQEEGIDTEIFQIGAEPLRDCIGCGGCSKGNGCVFRDDCVNEFVEKAKEAGADSFWYKDATPEELLAVMDRTMEGESVYPDTTPEVMVGTAKSCEFTRAEIEVLRLVVEGKSYKRIAENLEISHETVKWHISNMLRKTNFDSKTKLAVAVTQKNLIINGF